MNNLKYAIKNIGKMIRVRPAMMLIIFLSQVLAINAILMSFGFVNNALTKKKQVEDEARQFLFWFYVNDEVYDVDRNDPTIMFAPTYGQLKDKFADLIDFLGDDYKSITLLGYYGL